MDIVRKCISCGNIKTRNELIKITKINNSGDIVIEPGSKIFGRSAYLCYNQSCIDSAFKKNKINKALKTNTNIDKSTLEDLLKGYLKGTINGQFKS